MASLNKVLLMGNLTRDPRLRYTTGGVAVGELGLAVNRRWRSAQGEDREETCFVDIEVWSKQAETCNDYLRKGSPVLIEGRLKLDQWEDKQTGQQRSRLRVRADSVQFLGAPARQADDDRSGGPPPQRQQRGQQPAPRAAPSPPAGPPPPPFPDEPGDAPLWPSAPSGPTQPAPPPGFRASTAPGPPQQQAPPQVQSPPPQQGWSEPAAPAGPEQGDDIDDDIPF